MISLKEKSIIKKLASRYRVKRVLLFGSSLSKKSANDIDLAVEGLPAKRFFEFYEQNSMSLMCCTLSKFAMALSYANGW